MTGTLFYAARTLTLRELPVKRRSRLVTGCLTILLAILAAVTAPNLSAQAVPDLTITKSHTGSFLQGQVGAAFTVTVSNTGSAPTSSPVTMSDSLPAGLTPTAAAGAGWVCNVAAQNVACTRSDALNNGASYPSITLTVNVAPAAPPSLTNTATVSGGGDVNTNNNTATDVATILPGPDLIVGKTHAGNFTQGLTGTYSLTVSNTGGTPTSGVVTAVDAMPAGLTPVSAAGTGWSCVISPSPVTCTRSDPLAAGQSYPVITLTVAVQANAPASVTNVVAVSGGGDVNSTNNSASDPTTIGAVADLAIAKAHMGSFFQGQLGATYSVSVSNVGNGPTSGLVTMSDALPAGLVPTAAAGAGWACNIAAQNVVCTRSDALPAGSSYPTVTLTVNVSQTAPSSVTNIATVSGGGDTTAGNNTASNPTTITFAVIPAEVPLLRGPAFIVLLLLVAAIGARSARNGRCIATGRGCRESR
jgi:uncharacterized repeat protein (TIGR01451 family)